VDAGTFDLTLEGVAVGREEFMITRRGDHYQVHSYTELAIGTTARLFDGELETDLDWRPLEGGVRDVKDGGTVAVLGGQPLTLSEQVGGVPSRTLTAPAPVDLFLAENTMIHLQPLCEIAGPATRVGFPAMTISIGREHHLGQPVAVRDVDLGGAVKAVLYCDGRQLIGVDVPITGLTAVRSGRYVDVSLARPLPKPEPTLPTGLIELTREVVVRGGRHTDPATLACTLLVPASHATRTRRDRKTALPAVVFVTGSGAQDRDENTVGGGGLRLGAFKVLAIALGKAGVASMRCDDRGTGASTGDFGTATLDTFIADATATIAALRKEPAVDPARIGVIGHSEGGVIAPILAARDRRLIAIALLAAPGRPLDVVLLEQVARALRRAGTADDERAAALERHRAAFAAIRASEPLPDTAEAREWMGGEAWLRSHLHHDPAAAAARLGKLSVLIAQGGKDQQVGVVDAEALEDALHRAGRPRVTYRFYPDLNHLFARSTTGDVSEYADPDAVVDPAFVADVVTFFAAL